MSHVGDLELPRSLGDYNLLRRIAVGGMAEVYVATAAGVSGFERLVAVKVIHPRLSEDDHFVQMLVEEAKISVLLSHPNIVQCFDLCCIDEQYFIVMEYIEGADAYRVMQLCSQRKMELPIDVAVFIASEVLAGLDHAHGKVDGSGTPLGIVHRDVSPQNVLVSLAGEVKLADFGIAKAGMRTAQTEAGVIKGKYYYMSPEQAWGDPTDHRSDIFSTGVVLYELLTGQMLYQEENVPALLDRVRKAEIAPPTSLRPDIPGSLVELIMWALKKKPEERFQSAREFQTALREQLSQLSPSFSPQRLASVMHSLLDESGPRPAVPLPRKPKAPPLDSRARQTAEIPSMQREDYAPDASQSVIFDLRAELTNSEKRSGSGFPTVDAVEEWADSTVVDEDGQHFLQLADDLFAEQPADLPEGSEPLGADDFRAQLPYRPQVPTADLFEEEEEGETLARPMSAALLAALNDDATETSAAPAAASYMAQEDKEEPTVRASVAQLRALVDPLGATELAPARSTPARSTPEPSAPEPSTVPEPAPRTAAGAPLAPVAPLKTPERYEGPTAPYDPFYVPPPGAVSGGVSGPFEPAPSPTSPPFARAETSRELESASFRAPRPPVGRYVLLGLGAVLGGLVFSIVFGVWWLRGEPPPPIVQIEGTSGARVRLDGRELPGTIPMTIQEGLLPGQSYRLEVYLEGYHPWSTQFQTSEGTLQQIAVLRPLQVQLRIETVPPGAEVRVGRHTVGESPVVVGDLQVGRTVEVQVRHPDHGRRTQRIELTATELEPTLTIDLTEPAQR